MKIQTADPRDVNQSINQSSSTKSKGPFTDIRSAARCCAALVKTPEAFYQRSAAQTYV